jgi:Glycosyl transferase family 2
MASASRPALSVIVELDNILHSKVGRAQTMLSRLLAQLREGAFDRDVEVLVMYDKREIHREDAERIVTAKTLAENPFVDLVATDGLRYFSLKNEGAFRSRGDIIIFVDSDCVPEERWLCQLLEPFRDPEVGVVTGNSYIDRDTFYAKTFAAGWYFPDRLPDGPLVAIPTTFVNTLAIRRHIFEKYPFPEVSSLYMGQGVLWNRTLGANGVSILLNPRARVAHPPPVFLRSAIVNGYDTAQRTRQPGDTRLQSLKQSYWGFRGNLRVMFQRILARRRAVGISPIMVPFAIGLAGAYWTLWSFFELVTRLAPGLIPHTRLR